MSTAPARSKHLLRAAKRFRGDEDFLIRHVTHDMLERLSVIKRDFDSALALFGRTPFLAQTMKACPQIKSVTRVEEAEHIGEADHIASFDALNLQHGGYDLALAPLTLHDADDLPGCLIQIRRALKSDGLLMGVLPGPDTLQELRNSLLTAESELTGAAAQRIDAFTDIRDAGALLQRAGFALPVADHDLLTVRYDTAFDLIRDLRAFGATRIPTHSTPPLTRAIASRAAQIYGERYSDADGRVRASFSLVSLSGWVPHESQQKPLSPGSAKSRLADALKTDEIKLKR